MPVPPPVMRIARTLLDAGFETWCVGGAVRDHLLGEPNVDIDLATAAPPSEVQRLFRRTVPIGVEHGTVAVLDDRNVPHEVTTFRKDVRTDGRHADVVFGVSLEEDLARRDLTINAIAFHPVNREWRDPFAGMQDVRARLIRAVGDPAVRFREDYLRILRVLRFAARFGFHIDAPTWTAAAAAANHLDVLSAERVRDEWMKGLRTARSVQAFVRLWERVGALEIWMSEMVEAVKEERRLWSGLDRLPRDPVLITAALSADPAATLRRLRARSADIARADRMARHRKDRPVSTDPVDVRRWLARVGAAAGDLLTLWAVECPGEAELVEAVRRIRNTDPAVTITQLAVNGTDLQEAGVPPGPPVGDMLRRLLDEVLVDPALNERARLLRRVARLVNGA